jgi:O-antigen ligase
MIGSLAHLIGIRYADASSGPRMPQLLFILLAATLALFYANNAASSPITPILISIKWLPMAALCVAGLNMLRSRRAPAPPVVAVSLLLILAGICLLGSLMGGEPGRSVLALVTVLGAVIFGYAVSALVVATNSRRALFELVANITRVVVISAALFLLARTDLGRGGGFAAWTDNPNTLALMLAPGMVVFMAGCIERRPGWVTWHAAFFVVGAYLVWITNARAVVLWLSFSGIAFWLYRRGPALTSIGALVTLAVVLEWWERIRDFLVDQLGLNWSVHNVGISPLSGREEVWRIGWHLWEGRPLLGYGFGTTQTLLKAESWRFVQFQGGHFHSSYFETLVETGLLGFMTFMALLGFTLARGIADSGRTRDLPPESWPLAALPFAIILGAVGHALFESWLLAAGNVDAPLFWTCLFLIYHQAQIPVHAVRAAPQATAYLPKDRRVLPVR